AILTWPGNGNVALGQSAQLAPYYDLNNNGVYEPMLGDYPLIRGDQAVFFIQNDNRRLHSETTGDKLGVEIHGMAYAFDCQDDSALVYTTFLHYDVINRSNNTYHDTYFGTFTDTDLGYAWDDYVGCDVGRGSFYCYNGRNIDGSGKPDEYGAFPPAISTTVLGGPYLDPDNLDNPKTDTIGNQLCDLSINGLFFEDGIQDNERYGMSKFVYTTNCSSGPTCDPSNAPDYYKIMRGLWKDSTHMMYGGNGHPNSGATGPDCSFMFPDLSDFCNWGTNGIQPIGYETGSGGNGPSWTEANVSNLPDDRRGTISMGPFTFLPGATQELDIAFVWARQYTDSSATAVIP
ncbi:MAG: T9SS C-terminal target domain-containing protein, partial [Bacteroidetes bacterium]|nr:T9SS C-terminal target domain-containing protein [Bacteroidota bacterium]